jgi:Xaa-Pro aminopeptidase
MALFSEGEIVRRRKAITAAMVRDGIDGAIVSSQHGVYYATGMLVADLWGRPNVAILRKDGRTVLLVSGGEALNAETNAHVDEIIPYGDSRNVLSVIEDGIREQTRRLGLAGARLAVETDYVPYRFAAAVREVGDGREPASLEPILADARITKSAEELELLRIGGEAAKVGMRAFLEDLREGATEAELVAAAQAAVHRFIGQARADAPSSSFAYCNIGLNTFIPHLHPTGRRLEQGDIVGLNVFPVVAGYLIELERTLVFGRATDEQKVLLDVVGQAFAAGKEAVKDGVRACDVYEITRKVREARGFGTFTRGGAGHSHGILIGTNGREELGEIRPYNTTILREGMVVSIEPGIYLPGVGAYRHSDVVVVGRGRSEVITEFAAPTIV